MSQHSAQESAEEAREDLADALTELAHVVCRRGDDSHDPWLLEHAQRLSQLAVHARECYARLLPADGEIPTSAQGVALARFLRGHLRDRSHYATVCRGGAGLPDSCLYVRFDDGYEGGIEREGRTST